MQGPQWIPPKGSGITHTNGEYWIYENGNWRILLFEELQEIARRNSINDAYDKAMKGVICFQK